MCNMHTQPDSHPSSVTGHTDPAGESPWVMQLVVRAEKDDLPTRTAACETAASATVHLLHQAAGRPEWQQPVDRWLQGRIRKHVRRARGAKWDRASEHPGVTLANAGAIVRAFVPTAVDDIPRDVGRLQLSGLELPDPVPRRHAAPSGGLVVAAIQPDPRLSTGKAAAAACHAAQLAWMRMSEQRRQTWHATNFGVRLAQPPADRFDQWKAEADAVVTDAGFTEVESGTVTAVACWT